MRLGDCASRSVVIESPNTDMAQVASGLCECDPQGAFGVEFLARVLMAETGEWKEKIRDRRDGRNPILFTRRGCCCCEVTLRDGAHDPDWTYVTRPLSASEKASFHEEYGNSADLLTGLSIGSGMMIRGFVLNGRIPEWNLSVQRHDQ
jgi:hypothetical protein